MNWLARAHNNLEHVFFYPQTFINFILTRGKLELSQKTLAVIPILITSPRMQQEKLRQSQETFLYLYPRSPKHSSRKQIRKKVEYPFFYWGSFPHRPKVLSEMFAKSLNHFFILLLFFMAITSIIFFIGKLALFPQRIELQSTTLYRIPILPLTFS